VQAIVSIYDVVAVMTIYDCPEGPTGDEGRCKRDAGGGDEAGVPRVDDWRCDIPLGGNSYRCMFCSGTADPRFGITDCNLATDAYTRCSGEASAEPGYFAGHRPYWHIDYAAGFRGYEPPEPFVTQERYIYVVRPELRLLICPCAPADYCPQAHESDAVWLCRALILT
jgi:hypothetical protein